MIYIVCGQAADQYFSGVSYSWALQDASTLRFSSQPFSYKIPVEGAELYVVRLKFVEPVATAPARVFSVTINDEVKLPRFSMSGYLQTLYRTFVVGPADGFINIGFNTIVRSAVIASITVEPLVLTQYVVPSDPKTERVTSVNPVWWSGEGYYVPRPISVPDPTISLLYQNIAVYRNGLRETQFTTPSVLGQLKILPANGQAWPDTDTILVDYTAVWPIASQLNELI